MTKEQVLALYGTQQKVAAALGITQGAVSFWGETIPPLQQIRLERLTVGALKADPECWGVPVDAT